MLFARLPDYPKYRIYINGDIYAETRSKYLTPKPNHHGYMRIQLCSENKRKMFYLHKLLGMLFFPCNATFDRKVEVDHINIDNADNRLINLRLMHKKGQNLNKRYRPTNTGFPFINERKHKNCKSGFIFSGEIHRNSKYIIKFKRAKLEDAVNVMREFIIKNYDLVTNGLPKETINIINEKYNIRLL